MHHILIFTSSYFPFHNQNSSLHKGWCKKSYLHWQILIYLRLIWDCSLSQTMLKIFTTSMQEIYVLSIWFGQQYGRRLDSGKLKWNISPKVWAIFTSFDKNIPAKASTSTTQAKRKRKLVQAPSDCLPPSKNFFFLNFTICA